MVLWSVKWHVVLRIPSGFALTDLVHDYTVTELVQAAAQPRGRVQALQAGPPLLCRPHLPGPQGSTAATAHLT